MLHPEDIYRVMNERPPSAAPIVASFVLAALFLLAAAVAYTAAYDSVQTITAAVASDVWDSLVVLLGDLCAA
jgi:hypothetical protein